jgi:hypothetical protein
MTSYQENFDQLHFTECTFGSISISDRRAEIKINGGLILLSGHPAFLKYRGMCPPAVLHFNFVREFTRKSSPYIGDPKEGVFGIPEEDGEKFSAPHSSSIRYELEGVTSSNPSWIDLSIVADAFELIVLD